MNVARAVFDACGGKRFADLDKSGSNCLIPGPGHGTDDRSLSVKNDPRNPDGFVVQSFAGDDAIVCRDHVRKLAGIRSWQPTRKERPADPQFVYRDQKGEPYLRVTKVLKPTGKSFYQHSWNGRDWVRGAPQVRIPYRLPELLSTQEVFICEGEKDADRVAGLGLVATSAPEGAGKWRDELNQWFAGKHVIILADNDKPGRDHADQVEAGVRSVAASVRQVHFPMLPEKGDVSDWLDMGNGAAELSAYCQEAVPVEQRERFSLDWFGDIQDSMPKETFIKGVFGVNEFTMLSGKPGSGKSVITTDMACHVAAGMDWHGRKVRQGLVVYIAAERKDLTKRRMLAFRKRHGVGSIPLLVLGGRMDLTSGLKDAEDIAATIKRAEQECGMPCVWIVVDTLTRVFGPGDQNASKDMTKFIQACDAIREAVTGSHVTVIHHTGWAGDRGKGAIDLDGAVDASFLVKKEAGAYVLECDGTNDGDEGVITHFAMEGVQVGIDEDGQATMAPVVVPSDGKSIASKLVEGVKGHAAKAHELILSLGHEGADVPEGMWRAAFYDAYPGVEAHTLKVRFQRARKTLLDSGIVTGTDGTFRLVQDGTNGTCAADVPCADSDVGINIDGTNGTHPLGCADVPVNVPGKREECAAVRVNSP
ncbi:AAA family ATPase [Aureimonas altamirensis]|uniref:AAA family ATPase n=1 Tax=Aureimonas altamirensis TaxID=370622 RepID=UPI00255498DF|nr:AAA family ATPase [Aureimonas altamirensis]